MPTKNKKSKAEKRLERQRRDTRTVLSFCDEHKMKKDFCEIVETLWDERLDEKDKNSEDLTLHGDISEFCALGWNILVTHQVLEDAQKFVVERVAHKFSQEPVISEIINDAMELKYECCPEHLALIDETTVFMKDGKPVINVKFDMDEFQEKVEELAALVPDTCDILDQDALDRALEGVPEEQMKDTLYAAIKAQIAEYNNTPQDHLGGLTPREVFHQRKNS